MRIVGYVRISVETDTTTSPERQRQAIEAAVSARGDELVSLEQDIGVSASKSRLQRPGLQAARAAIHDGRADAIMVMRLDRLCRSVVDFGTLVDEGVHVVSVTEAFDTTTPMGRAMAEILQVFARMESETTALRVASAVKYLRQHSKFPGGPIPYGYTTAPHPSGSGRALTPLENTAQHVRWMAERIQAGWSLSRVTKDLNRRGVPAATGGGWTTASVKALLVRPSTYGYSLIDGQILRAEDGLPIQTHEPLLDDATRIEIAEIFSRNKSNLTRRRSHSRTLSGLVHCGSCGTKMYVHHPTSSKTTTSYVCRAGLVGRHCDKPTSIAAVRLEQYVENKIMQAVGHVPLAEEKMQQRGNPDLQAVNAALRDLADMMTKPGADIAALAQQLTNLHDKRAQLEAEAPVYDSQAVLTGQTFQEAWEESEDVDEKRAMLESIIKTVNIHPATARTWQPERIQIITL